MIQDPPELVAMKLALGQQLAASRQAAELGQQRVGRKTGYSRSSIALLARLGVDLRRFRRQLFVLCALLTGVAVAGGIGFVGLMVPNAVRMLVGADHRRVLPVALLLGAIFMIWADVLVRTVASPLELPIGIVTALFGTPFFVLIMRQRRKTLQTGSR